MDNRNSTSRPAASAGRAFCCLPVVFAAFAALSASARGGYWWENPEIQASMAITSIPGYVCPHFMNKDNADKYLMVNMGIGETPMPFFVYRISDLVSLAGHTNDINLAVVATTPLELGFAGTKGGAVSSFYNIALPGFLGMSWYSSSHPPVSCPAVSITNSYELVDQSHEIIQPYSFSTTNGFGGDGIDFGSDGRYLYSNVYSGNQKHRICKWRLDFDPAPLVATNDLVLLKTFDTSVKRVRNISVHKIAGRELVFYGEGRISASIEPGVYVLDVTDDTEWKQHLLVASKTLFTSDITNVKVSGENTANPTLYVCMDEGRMHIFNLNSNGLTLAGETPVRTFDHEELDLLRGIRGHSSIFRNFDVTQDGKYAFFINDNQASGSTGIVQVVTCGSLADDFEGNAVVYSFSDIWSAWSSEEATPMSVPDSVGSWDALARSAWNVRDSLVRSGTRTEIPPSDKPIVVSLGAISVPASMLPNNGADFETEFENGIDVWRLRLRECDGDFIASIGGQEFSIGAVPPYHFDEWVRAVYGDVPAWLTTEERDQWLAARRRARMEWFATLVPNDKWDEYVRNRTSATEALVEDREIRPSLFLSGIRPATGENSLLSVTARSLEAGSLRLFSSTNLLSSLWDYGGFSLQPQGEEVAGLVSTGSVGFVFAVLGDGDADADGIPDAIETYVFGTSPSRCETGGGGLTDWERIYRFELNPFVRDSAGDGISDLEKMERGSDPRVPISPEERVAASRSIRYTYDDDDRLTGTWFGTGGGAFRTGISPAGNPEKVTNSGAEE